MSSRLTSYALQPMHDPECFRLGGASPRMYNGKCSSGQVGRNDPRSNQCKRRHVQRPPLEAASADSSRLRMPDGTRLMHQLGCSTTWPVSARKPSAAVPIAPCGSGRWRRGGSDGKCLINEISGNSLSFAPLGSATPGWAHKHLFEFSRDFSAPWPHRFARNGRPATGMSQLGLGRCLERDQSPCMCVRTQSLTGLASGKERR